MAFVPFSAPPHVLKPSDRKAVVNSFPSVRCRPQAKRSCRIRDCEGRCQLPKGTLSMDAVLCSVPKSFLMASRSQPRVYLTYFIITRVLMCSLIPSATFNSRFLYDYSQGRPRHARQHLSHRLKRLLRRRGKT